MLFFVFEAAAKADQQQEQQSKRVRFQESGAAENGLDVTDNGESVMIVDKLTDGVVVVIDLSKCAAALNCVAR